jgi:hypothetical protein
VSTDSIKDKMKVEYDSIFKRAEEIGIIRKKLHSDLIEVRTQLRELEQKYKTTLDKIVESTSDPLLPMTIAWRAVYGILVGEYIDIGDNRRIGEYKMMGYYP